MDREQIMAYGSRGRAMSDGLEAKYARLVCAAREMLDLNKATEYLDVWSEQEFAYNDGFMNGYYEVQERIAKTKEMTLGRFKNLLDDFVDGHLLFSSDDCYDEPKPDPIFDKSKERVDIVLKGTTRITCDPDDTPPDLAS